MAREGNVMVAHHGRADWKGAVAVGVSLFPILFFLWALQAALVHLLMVLSAGCLFALDLRSGHIGWDRAPSW